MAVPEFTGETILGIIANALLLLCAAYSYRSRYALLAGAGGSLLWAILGFNAGWWNLVAIEVLAGSLQVRGFLKWER